MVKANGKQREAVLVGSLVAPLLAVMAGQGAESLEESMLRGPSKPIRNRVALSYRVGINIGVEFENLGGFPELSLARTTAEGDRYNYDDGYNLPDISGSGVETWYWGYENAGADPDNFVSMSRVSAESTDVELKDLREGAELTYWRVMGPLDLGHWGLLAAVNVSSIRAKQSGSFSGAVTERTDSFAVLAPPVVMPPHTGSLAGPGPLISLTPSSSTVQSIPGGATGTIRRDYEAELYGFRVGPYVELPLTKRWTVNFSGGLALGWVQSDYDFEETVMIPQLGTMSAAGSNSGSDFVLGGFVGLEFWYSLSYRWSGFVGAQYQYLESPSHSGGGKKVRLDLGQSVFVAAGLGYAF